MSLSDDDSLKRNLRKIFHLHHFINSKQKQAVKAILKQDRDVLISMPTDSRMSLCFQLPGVMIDSRITIVLSPSTHSIKNQIRDLKKCKISATSITSTLSDDELKRITKDISEKPEIRFLYVTPEHASTEYFANILESWNKNDKLAYIAVYDAHIISQDFRQEYIKSLRKAIPSVPWIVLTHIASADVLNDIVEKFHLREPIAKFTKSSFRKNLYYDIIFKNTIVDLFAHLKHYVTSCLENGDGNVKKTKKSSGIIFCKDRETVELVTKKLTDEGIATKAHHGGMTSKQRKQVQNDWIAGVLPVITTTTNFGAGIDKSSVRFVVHWDVPQSIVSYYKKSGLAGRDGKDSYCRIYYCRADVIAIDSALKRTIGKSKDENGRRKALRAHADFLKMSDLCETVICRHKTFSDYFEDNAPKCESKCDVCADPQQANVALDIFHRLAAGVPSRDNQGQETLTLNTSIKLERPESENETTAPNFFRPPRSISPATTVIKEENGFDSSALSFELFGMQTLAPVNVSPARTIIKSELDESSIGIDPGFVNDSFAVDSKAGLNLFLPQRCVSPAETVVEEKPVVNSPSSDHSSVFDSPNSIRSAKTNSTKSLVRESSSKSNVFPATLANPITPTATRTEHGNGTHDIESYVTVIQQEQSARRSSNRSSKISHREHRSPSPTETIVKEECLTPERNDCFKDLFDESPVRDGTSVESRERIIESYSERNSEILRELDRVSLLSPQTKISCTVSKPTAVDTTDYNAVRSLNSVSVSEREQSNESENRRSLSNYPIDDRENFSRNSRISLPSRRSRSRSFSRTQSRSISNERLKHEKLHGSHEPSGFEWTNKRRRVSQESDSDERERKAKRRRKCDGEMRGRMERYSTDSEATVVNEKNSIDRYRYTQPSTSTIASNKLDSKRRFSVSPENKKFGTKIEGDSKWDYGWEDAPPPKLKSERHSKSPLEDLDISFKAKMKEFNCKLQNEYDLDVIEASRKELFQAIEDSIAMNTQKKLTDLDERIRKRQNDYVRQLFGTDNFDSWDDDPALSNVERTEELKPFKAIVPDDIPLLDKMSMKNVFKAKNISSAKDRQEQH